MSSRSPLSQLHHLDTFSSTFEDQVLNILYGQEYRQWMQHLQGDNLVGLADYLDKVHRCILLLSSPLNVQQALNALDPASAAFRKCLRELRYICGARAMLPTSYTVASHLLDVGSRPVASGSSADVYEGIFNGSKVCVKRIRTYFYEGPEKVRRPIASSVCR
jgi:hypothetical protein